jgi:hypothetical protein
MCYNTSAPVCDCLYNSVFDCINTVAEKKISYIRTDSCKCRRDKGYTGELMAVFVKKFKECVSM